MGSESVDDLSSTVVPGLEATIRETVTAAMTAATVRSGDVPVLATPVLLALAERAAVAALTDRLPPGLTSVGTRADLSHLAPTPVGAAVSVRARLEAVDGRRLTFSFSASDPAGQVAAGTHTRMVVDRRGFELAVARRLRGG